MTDPCPMSKKVTWTVTNYLFYVTFLDIGHGSDMLSAALEAALQPQIGDKMTLREATSDIMYQY